MKTGTKYTPVEITGNFYNLEKVGDKDFYILGFEAVWVEWDENNRFKSEHKKAQEGFSLLIDPYGGSYSWLTTPVTEIITNTKDLVEFKTKNSHYKLHWNENRNL